MTSSQARNGLRLVYSFTSRLGVAGIGNIAWQQAAGLAELGIDVTLICGSCERAVPGITRLVETMKIGGLKLPYRLLGHGRAFRRHDRIVASYLRKSAETIDIVHCWPLGSLKTLEAAKSTGVVSFLERPNTHTGYAYSVVDEECRRLGLQLGRRNSHKFNAERLNREMAEYALADRLACPSEFVAQTFLDRGFSSERLARHQYGYDPTRFSPPEDHAFTRRRQFTAAFVAQCEPRKGLHFLLDAWFRSGAAERGILHILGKFVPGYRELLADKLSHPSINVVGFTADVPGILKESDVLILPSIEEGSALVTYEGRACGCALLVSDATGARCTHLVDALVHKAGNVDTLTQHLTAVMNDHALLQRLREASLRSIGELTWLHAAERMKELYLEALAKIRSGSRAPASYTA